MSGNTGQRALHNARLRKQRQADASVIFERALALHQSGSIGEAQALYRQILQQVPNHFGALQFLGVSESQSGRYEEADRLLRQAVLLDPRSAAVLSNRGVVLHELGRLDEALASFNRALAIEPNLPDAFDNRGNVLFDLERYDEALASHDSAIARRPDYAEAFNNRANALRALERFDEALASCDRAIALNPGYAKAFNNRGSALFNLGRLDEAVASYDRALGIEPSYSDAWCNRGEVLTALERFDEALASHDRALAIKADLVPAWLGRANILRTDRVAEAFGACERALAVEPDSPKALTMFGLCYANLGDAANAIACFDRVLAIKPDHADAISNKIFLLDFDESSSFERHQAIRAYWWEQIGADIAIRSQLPHGNDRDPTRRIVLGYVSSDFRRHSAAFAFRPVLMGHDKMRFEVICYSCSPIEDDFTRDFQQNADAWRRAWQLSDDQLADRIRADKVDILIDLSGHTAGHRLRTFARKPAPIQITAWGHGTGTGLPTIDYLFSDPILIPAAVRHLFAEGIFDLPCCLTIEPPPPELRCSEPPVLSKGHVTYGVFNRAKKISDGAIEIWARILDSDTRARLLIKDKEVDDQSVQLMLRDKFGRRGVPADRIDFLGSTPWVEHLAAYANVDLCLDPFPQNGGISTWEALHMGVPVVARLGDGLPARISGAILSSIGMGEWVAATDDGYAEIALKYASMPDRLRTIRHELPARIAKSASSNPAAYTRAVEQAYRTMWEDYCSRAT
jgi:predicted O-linked N-acetylglucosamine transferase (SPINDLY family)